MSKQNVASAWEEYASKIRERAPELIRESFASWESLDKFRRPSDERVLVIPMVTLQ